MCGEVRQGWTSAATHTPSLLTPTFMGHLLGGKHWSRPRWDPVLIPPAGMLSPHLRNPTGPEDRLSTSP